MRTNLPVTQREHPMAEHATLMSTTDTDSRITYANAAFVAISGFERDELLGQPHNLVRHPDMPREAFADMWATIKAGDAWTALVKNRRKDGDHYWVRANVTPVRRGGEVIGYMSVRTRPEADEVRRAEALYADFRGGRARGRRFHKGLVVRTGWLAWTSALQRAGLRTRLTAGVLLAGAPGALAALWAGVSPWTAVPALLGPLAAGLWLDRQVHAPLRQVLDQARSIAAGQPRANVQLNRADEIGMLMRSVNQAGLNQRSLVDDVGDQTTGLQTATGEIASGNADLSGRTEQAAANLQQTAASMEELNRAVRQNADTATQAALLADEARGVADRGGTVVGEVVASMRHISDSARRIGDIIGVIDGIAFQTNILALNAAVEAARAGEQGRGFAVVASEVRALAGRSADAAKEIKRLIGDSGDKVDDGVRQVQEAGVTMEDIVRQVGRVAELIGEISGASAQQTSGITQVATAVAELDRSTQQNAALVEQSAAAASQLAQRAARLVDAVSVFRR